ncbi:MAG: 5-(carboxyamino)imidazole ribonucleotide synthase [Chitinophagales bacterium]|nr:5-(carboxyamino)imidazole ribonucleotide synthase [Bacteroidota bacterium]MCB9043808.1 5-(carboxyamino)imidazole ribonucleotide synthase [Chitinophagales bacterium]
MHNKIGILGAGQLGRMLCQAAINYDTYLMLMDRNEDAPAASFCDSFVVGDLLNFEDVYAFGKKVDCISIEIEHVNVQALAQLEKEGVEVIPRAAALQILQDKCLQKQFYEQHNIPTAAFTITQNREEIRLHQSLLPAYHKLATLGYDGRGVQYIESENDWKKGFEAKAVLEKAASIEKEIAVIVLASRDGKQVVYEPVELVFNPQYNQLDYLLSPASLGETQILQAKLLAEKVVKALASPGIFAVEMFVLNNGEIWVNETAPRVHNSGHASIEANFSSQFDQLIRLMLDIPLGSTQARSPSLMINLIGEKKYIGKVKYEGLDEVANMEGVYIHLYGKKETRPGRKMGHITIIDNDTDSLIKKAKIIKNTLKVVSQ